MSANVMVIDMSDGAAICLSYGVPVAAFVPGVGYVKTSKFYSKTTSKHANAFCGSRTPKAISHEEFAAMIHPLEVN